jgi:hypothetical protein
MEFLISQHRRSCAAGMGTNQRRLDRIEQKARGIEHAKVEREAKRVVAIWNARKAGTRELWFYPTMGAAVLSGYPWLCFYCPACQQIGQVDLHTLDRHRGATIESLIPSLSCRRCRPNPRLSQDCWASQRSSD